MPATDLGLVSLKELTDVSGLCYGIEGLRAAGADCGFGDLDRVQSGIWPNHDKIQRSGNYSPIYSPEKPALGSGTTPQSLIRNATKSRSVPGFVR